MQFTGRLIGQKNRERQVTRSCWIGTPSISRWTQLRFHLDDGTMRAIEILRFFSI